MATVEKVLAVTPAEERKIKASYEKSEEELMKDVEILKEWLKKQHHLPKDEDEHRIKMLLIINKCNVEKTKKKLDTYYSIKHLVPEFYDFRHPLHPDFATQLDYLVFAPLPKLTPECHRVNIAGLRTKDPTTFRAIGYLKLAFVSQDLRIMCDPALGEHYICDAKNAKFAHFVQFTPALIKKCYTIMEKAYSDRIKGIHFINLPAAGSVLVALVTAVLSKKLANRVKVHKNNESLHKCIPKEILPAEYGGNAGTIEEINGNWRKCLESKNDWIKELCEKRSDESKRVGKPIISDIFGVCGPFRKLTFD